MKAPIILFPDSIVDHKLVDPSYAFEKEAATNLGFDCFPISYELLAEGKPNEAIRRVAQLQPCKAMYRGWMLSVSQYATLHAALAQIGIELMNTPSEYEHCHHLPASFDLIQSMSPRSVWFPFTGSDLSANELIQMLSSFGEKAIVVKDYVKSEKHNWLDACFIPNAADTDHALNVVRRFLELRGSFLQGGLVFREFVELEELTTHSKSGMPLTKEFRLFCWDGKAQLVLDYWNEGEYKNLKPDLDQFKDIIASIKSNFFTMDVAKQIDGNWTIMELGDAQVAGLPSDEDVTGFYKALSTLTL